MRSFLLFLSVLWGAVFSRRRAPVASKPLPPTVPAPTQVPSAERECGCPGCTARRAAGVSMARCVCCNAAAYGAEAALAIGLSRLGWRRSAKGWTCAGCVSDPTHTSLAQPNAWPQARCSRCGVAGPMAPTDDDVAALTAVHGWFKGACPTCARPEASTGVN